MKIFSAEWFNRVATKTSTTLGLPEDGLKNLFKTSVDKAIQSGRESLAGGLAETPAGQSVVSAGIDMGWRKFLPWILVLGVVSLFLYFNKKS